MRGIHRTGSTGAITLLFVVTLAMGSARAEEPRVVLLMPVTGSAPAPLRETILRALREGFQAQGLQVRDAAEASEALMREGKEPCEEAACLWRLVRDSGAWAGVLVGAWRSNWPGAEHRLVGSIVGPSTDRRAQQMMELTGSVEERAKELARRLLVAMEEEAPIDVLFDGRPEGTSVVVDGRLRGELPVRTRLRPGAHRVALSRYGQPGWQGELNLKAGKESVRIRVALDARPAEVRVAEGEAELYETRSTGEDPDAAAPPQPAGGRAESDAKASQGTSRPEPLTPAPSSPTGASARPWWAWGGIAALGVAAVALGIAGGLEASRDGCQQYDSAGVVCVLEKKPRPLAVAGLFLGSALGLGGAITLYVVTEP